jgi:moderate conductance mechanosensitive channel
VVWHIRNGTIESAGNESQGWSRAVIDYPVPYEEDLARIRALMEQAAGSLFRERGWRMLMLEEPEVWGAEELSSREVTMRIVAKTAPMRQWRWPANCGPGSRRRWTRPGWPRPVRTPS